jgi:dTDP-glucose 4,6-dehydratase
VSTDEVFGDTLEGFFAEDSVYRPSNPYSALKAGSDHLVRAWHRTYGTNVVLVNCSNNYGPRQHSEKLIPTVIASALAGRPIPVYGKGENVRDWLFVEDHCSALDLVFERATPGERYVVGGRNEWKNIDMVRLICRILDEEAANSPDGGFESLITFVDDRPGHDIRYAVDPAKIERELGWQPSTTLDEGLRTTVRWYLRND